MNSEQDNSHPPVRRQWLRFGLRTTLIVMTLVCACLARTTYLFRQQWRAEEEVVSHGGQVIFDDRWKNAPTWLKTYISEDFFCTPAFVHFDGGPANEILPLLADLRGCRDVAFRECKWMTDNDLQHLAEVHGLKTIDLPGARIHGHGLAHIGALKELEALDLGGTPLEDEGLKHLATCSKLKLLGLWDTNITDDGLAHISKLTALEDLQIRRTNVTDPGLKHLTKMKGLRKVLLGGTKVTQHGQSELQKALPNCVVQQ